MNNTEPKDYQRDGLCTANVQQQKTCANYRKHEGCNYEICKFQGLGTTCDFEGK